MENISGKETDMSAVKTIEIDLRNWCAGAPTGAVLYDGGYEGWSEVIDSEYCDSVEDFKDFITRNSSSLDPSETEITFRIEAADISTSNVMSVACEIADSISYALG